MATLELPVDIRQTVMREVQIDMGEADLAMHPEPEEGSRMDLATISAIALYLWFGGRRHRQ
jgi:aspartyl aminopeptidase